MLLARFSDDSPAVAEVLFDHTHETTLRKLVKGSHQAVYEASLKMINGSEVARTTVLAHMRFLLKEFISSVPQASSTDYKLQILQEAVWPKLLFTKSQLKTAQGVWALLAELETEWPVFSGCSRLPEDNGLESASTFNRALAKQLCHNISRSGSGDLEDFILRDCRCEGSSAAISRILSSMIVLELLQKGSTRASLQVLSMQSHSTAPLDVQLAKGDTLPSPDTLSRIYSKPSSANTLLKLGSEMLFGALLSVESPAESRWCWLEAKHTLSQPTAAYRSLAIQAYTLAHDKSIPSSIVTKVLASLFKKAIREEALAFLASIFAVNSSPATLRLIALRDTAVFLDACSEEEATASNDFQLVLPSIIVALSAQEKEIRQAAIRIVEKIYALAKSAKEQRTYGFDAYYGTRSSKPVCCVGCNIL
jgi:hypothetical protein